MKKKKKGGLAAKFSSFGRFATAMTAGVLAYKGYTSNLFSPGQPSKENGAINGEPPKNCHTLFNLAKDGYSKAAFTVMLEKLDTPGAHLLRGMAETADRHASERSYNKKVQTNPDLFHTRLAWDLRLLLHYNGPPAKAMTPELEKAIREFQFQVDLPETGKPDEKTLERISLEVSVLNARINLRAIEVARKHKISPNELLILISAESNGDTYAAAKTSSALGLGQFTIETWLDLVAQHGGKMDLDRYAKDAREIIAIRNANEKLPPEKQVKLTAEQQINLTQILSLRTNPDISIEMIAIYGKFVSDGEFTAVKGYIGYVVGKGGSATLDKNLKNDVSKIMKAAAKANESIFYKLIEKKDKKGNVVKDKQGQPVMMKIGRTGEEVKEELRRRVEVAGRLIQAGRQVADGYRVMKANEDSIKTGLQNVKCDSPSIVPDGASAGIRTAIHVK